MKRETESTSAKDIRDFSDGKKGTTTLDVPYEFTYDILENDSELREKFSPADLLKLANQRLKQTANSSARSKAVAPYAQDPSSPDAVRERMIKDMVSQGIPEDVATSQIDALLASVRKSEPATV